ncbi:hypothetical protein [Thiobaca trueperi]|uniref:Uncharacterized protein n=1 Tax=Thiobaca trueperi TaxID=127458 RepID=A0A4R3MZ39_9GAMM|nr:hypothetical protein [Thiobaca trueperi]TCT21970.1 hypothetical protein EDC35_10368 [Thiobaca trueperi]
MSTLEIAGLILTVEFALAAWAILFVLLRRQRQSLQTDHAHADAAIKELANNEVSRRDALSTLFQSTYGLEGAELESRVDAYVEREQAFYSAMLSLYLQRDGEKLKNLPAELTKVLTPWAGLTPSGMVPADEIGSQIGSLEHEKTQLATELEHTKRTLEQLMDEYMAAFDKAQAPPETPASPPSAPAEDVIAADIVFEEETLEEETLELDQNRPDARPDVSEPEPEIKAEPASKSTADLDALLFDDAQDEPEGQDEPPASPSADNLDDVFGETLQYDIEADDEPAPKPATPAPGKAEASQPDDPVEAAWSTPPRTEEEIAQEELEGLADLFDPPPPPAKGK